MVSLLHFPILCKSAWEPFSALRHRMGKEALVGCFSTRKLQNGGKCNGTVLDFFSSHLFSLAPRSGIDTFAAAFGFGIDQIRIPALSALVLSLVSSAALSLSMLAAGWLTPYLPAGLTGWLSCALLCGLGLLKLFDSAIKRLVRRLPQPGRELSFSFLRMRFLLRVWADPATADTDCSSVLSAAESVALALALSSDGLAAGLGADFPAFPPGRCFSVPPE